MAFIDRLDFGKFIVNELYKNCIIAISTYLSAAYETLYDFISHFIMEKGIYEIIKVDLRKACMYNSKSGNQSKSSNKLKICIGFSKYEAVYRVACQFGFREVGENDIWNIYWTDGFIGPERMIQLKEYQKINHFPGMIEICRKDLLAININRMIKIFPKEFNFIPKTWCLPTDMADFQAYCQKDKTKHFILKPEAGCQGRGIAITQHFKDWTSTDGMVCQVYVDKPLLVDGFKFDLRIYVLITSIDPLRIYAYNEGLVRFTTVKYEDPNQTNFSNVFMHLTNYTLQKTSENFIKDNEYLGTKRRISVLNEFFAKEEYDVQKIWQDIDDIIIKTIISINDSLKHNYRNTFPNHLSNSACFEILGFDIILDNKLKPFLIEVNHSPSFHTDAQLDRDIKDALLWDTFQIIQLKNNNRKFNNPQISNCSKKPYRKSSIISDITEQTEDFRQSRLQAFEYELRHMGNFRLLYFAENGEKYAKYILSKISLFHETTSYRARLKFARKIREDIRKKENFLKKDRKKCRVTCQLFSTSLKKIKRNAYKSKQNKNSVEEIKEYNSYRNNEFDSKLCGELNNLMSAATVDVDKPVLKTNEDNQINAKSIALSSICEPNIFYQIQSMITNIHWHYI